MKQLDTNTKGSIFFETAGNLYQILFCFEISCETAGYQNESFCFVLAYFLKQLDIYIKGSFCFEIFCGTAGYR